MTRGWIIERIRNPKNIGFYDNVNRNQKSWSAKISVKHLQIRFKSEARELEVHFFFLLLIPLLIDKSRQEMEPTLTNQSLTDPIHYIP